MNRLDTRPEMAPTLHSLDLFLKLSRQIGREDAHVISMYDSKRREKDLSWEEIIKETTFTVQQNLGLGKFASRRLKRILQRVESDINKVVDPILSPILSSVVDVMLQA